MMRPDPSRLAALFAEQVARGAMPAAALAVVVERLDRADLLPSPDLNAALAVVLAARRAGRLDAAQERELDDARPPRAIVNQATAARALGIPADAVRDRMRRRVDPLPTHWRAGRAFVDLDELRADLAAFPYVPRRLAGTKAGS